ncbi:hypothetical protein BDZ90DRAFT_257824 [Jaminaea rosea]|uniref:D-aminoacyl-tRNA deacylase n=1 Tax=Jaminaea rosea TaxID=1569628 RepID=A0A316V0J9_9BASI|nr:hypothetical protein BDZ90DRAFT_257824 [Jaminaea rosea]PWN30764.1 hypothetical protein BDZ90DRAFT_257824 [Jaminaea rosea]
MRAVLQRVTGACVHVDGKLVSTIGPGVVALIGIETEDEASVAPKLGEKILSLRMWNQGAKAWDITTPSHYPASSTRAVAPAATAAPTSSSSTDIAERGPVNERAEAVWGGKPWSSSVVELEGELLCISQFTLHARTAKGTRPDFHKSMGGDKAREIYEALLKHMRQMYKEDRIKDGAFGEMMDVSLSNDGPVTLIIDTADKRK